MKLSRFLIVSLVVLALAVPFCTVGAMAEEGTNPVVEVTGGKIRGFMNEGIYTFLGVPYAQAERFALPGETAWEGTVNAESYGAVAPLNFDGQLWPDDVAWPHRYWKYNETCHFANIWTTSLEAEAKKPIIVWIHGGGFSSGSSIEGVDYDGRNLSEYSDAVVVTFNHRLNVLGYFDMSDFGEEYADTANLGMLDIVFLLKWVKENAPTFGGDPDNITIFGQSGGGQKVLALMRMPEAEGLFSHAIAMSGTYGGSADAATMQEFTGLKVSGDGTAKEIVTLTLETLGLEDVSELKDVPYDTLIDAADEAIAKAAENGFTNGDWAPSVDGVHLLEDICDWAKDVDFMVGGVFSEFLWNFTNPEVVVDEWDEEETKAQLEAKFGDKADQVAAAFSAVYPDEPVGHVVYYKGDMRAAVDQTALWWEQHANKPAYTYFYKYEYPFNGGTLAFHCEDLHMWFHNLDLPEIRVLAEGDREGAEKCQEAVSQAFRNFVRTGNPGTEELEWAPHTAEEGYTMVFDTDSYCTILDDAELNELTSSGSIFF